MSPGAVLLLGVVTGIAGLIIGAQKGHPVWGFFLGLVLSVIGIAIIAVTKPTAEYQARKATERLRAEQEAQRRIGGR
jgi:hypothetical protein